jgi:hypothetical protein
MADKDIKIRKGKLNLDNYGFKRRQVKTRQEIKEHNLDMQVDTSKLQLIFEV